MEFREVVYGRRSTRDYADRPVDESILASLIDSAIQAPSALNEQPWAFTIITNKELLNRVSNGAKTYLLGTSAVGMGPSRFRDQLANPNFNIFYDAPALVVISAVGATPWAIEDCTLAAQNLMLTAHWMGLGSCWIGFAQHWLQTSDGKTMMHLPNHYTPVAPVIIGYAKAPVPPVARRHAVTKWIK